MGRAGRSAMELLAAGQRHCALQDVHGTSCDADHGCSEAWYSNNILLRACSVVLARSDLPLGGWEVGCPYSCCQSPFSIYNYLTASSAEMVSPMYLQH
mmetsp:Transcript_46643/g.115657  ORF Transcript_46643/g.115657 Transcript_46643/m.115657 type:complete len:98 (+) Transcript_46643:267-560(+)